MTLPTKNQLLSELAPPIDTFLASQLVDEFISIERRYVLRDWEPAELDGGQFCEILGRILYHLDSGNLNLSREFKDAIGYLENDSVSHALLPRKAYLHLVRVLRVVYKFRSDRGAVHISPTYSPNEMDARLVLENVRWVFAEWLRLVWKGERELVAELIRSLIRFDAPCVGSYDGLAVVQRTDISLEEEILILLHSAGESGHSRTTLGKSTFSPPSTVTTALRRLKDAKHRQIIELSNGNYTLTDLGAKRLREELAEKLCLN